MPHNKETVSNIINNVLNAKEKLIKKTYNDTNSIIETTTKLNYKELNTVFKTLFSQYYLDVFLFSIYKYLQTHSTTTIVFSDEIEETISEVFSEILINNIIYINTINIFSFNNLITTNNNENITKILNYYTNKKYKDFTQNIKQPLEEKYKNLTTNTYKLSPQLTEYFLVSLNSLYEHNPSKMLQAYIYKEKDSLIKYLYKILFTTNTFEKILNNQNYTKTEKEQIISTLYIFFYLFVSNDNIQETSIQEKIFQQYYNIFSYKLKNEDLINFVKNPITKNSIFSAMAISLLIPSYFKNKETRKSWYHSTSIQDKIIENYKEMLKVDSNYVVLNSLLKIFKYLSKKNQEIATNLLEQYLKEKIPNTNYHNFYLKIYTPISNELIKNNNDILRSFFIKNIITIDILSKINLSNIVNKHKITGKEKTILYYNIKEYLKNNTDNKPIQQLVIALKLLESSSIEGEKKKEEKICLTNIHNKILFEINREYEYFEDKMDKTNQQKCNKIIYENAEILNKKIDKSNNRQMIKEVFDVFSVYYFHALVYTSSDFKEMYTQENEIIIFDEFSICKVMQKENNILSHNRMINFFYALRETTKYIDLSFENDKILKEISILNNKLDIEFTEQLFNLYKNKQYSVFIPLMSLLISEIYSKKLNVFTNSNTKKHITNKYNAKIYNPKLQNGYVHFYKNMNNFYHYLYELLFENHHFRLRNNISHGYEIDRVTEEDAKLLMLFFLFTCYLNKKY